jgi:DUF438 domain-containing protein
MAKTYHNSNQWALAGLFKRINLGDGLKQLRSEASHLAGKVNSKDIAAAQQILINEGHSPDIVEKISSAFILLGLRSKKLESAENNLSDNHILDRIFAEHAMIRCDVSDLLLVSKQIDRLDTLTDISSEFRQLSRIVQRLIESKRQIDREDDLIFPYLEKYGWQGLCRTARAEHHSIKKEIDNLTVLVTGFNTIGPKDFKAWLQMVVRRFCPLLLNHLRFEQEVLWPIALVLIDDPDMWKRIRTLANEFEY